MKKGISVFRSVVFALVLITGTGCEEEINSVEPTDHAFSMFGLLNPTTDRQAIRVFKIDELLEQTKPEPIDARVVSTDLESGENIVWQDSLVQFRSGMYGHVFWASFKPVYEHRYRVEVIRSDGVKAEVEMRVPPISNAEVQTADLDGFFITVPVLWRDAPNLIDITVRYLTNVGIFSVDYNVDQSRVDGGQLVTINFRNDILVIFQNAIIFGVTEVLLNEMEMSVVVTDASWVPPGGVFDADLFSEPGTFSNVVDGFGFVGSGYEAKIKWIPDEELRRETGFTIPGG